MRSVAVIDAAGRGACIQQACPPIEPGQVLVRVEAASISSGTEMNIPMMIRRGEQSPVPLPRHLGYQNSGVVEEVADCVTALRPGDRVTCLGGGYALAADYAVVPQNLCCPLPEEVSFEEGAFANLVLTSLHALRRGEPELGQNLLVVGAGVVGQFAAQFGRIAGLNTMVSDTLPMRLDYALQTGAHATVNVAKESLHERAMEFTDGFGFDVAIVAIGGEGTQVLKDIGEVMKLSPDGHRMGRIVLVGGLHVTLQGGAGIGNVEIVGAARTGPGYHDPEWEHGRREYPETFVRWTTRSNLQWAMKLVTRGDLKIKPLITHRLPLAEVGQAVEMLIEQPQECLGIALKP